MIERNELMQILDDADFAVYITKVDSYELLYLNATAKKMGGFEPDTLYDGKTCYELLMNRTDPCPFCRLSEMKPDRFFVRNYTHPKTGRIFEVKGKQILWNGEEAHIEYIRDVTLERLAVQRENEERRQLIEFVDNLPVGACVYRIKGKEITPICHNETFYEVFGYSEENRRKIEHKTEWLNVHPDDMDKLQTELYHCIAICGKTRLTYRMFNDQKQRYIYIGLTAQVEKQPDGSCLGYVIYQDIDEEIKTGMDLQMMDEVIQSGFAKILDDETYTITYCNHAFLKELGLTRQELDETYHREFFRMFIPEDRERVVKAVATMKEGVPMELEYRLRLHNSVQTFLDRSVLKTDTNGQRYFYLTFTNITKQKIVDKMLKSIVDTNFDMLSLVDLKWDKILYTIQNDRLSYYDKKTLQNAHPLPSSTFSKTSRDFFVTFCIENPEEAAQANSIQTITEKLCTAKIYSYVATAVNPKTDEFEHLLYQYTYFDATHEKVLCSRMNITETYQKERRTQARLSFALQKATEANKAKTAFLSTVSHDMRTPLNGILGLTELMLDSVSDQSLTDDLKQLQNSGQYLLNLINDTLDVSKIESGKFELSPSVCDGRRVLRSIMKLVEPNIQEKNINLQWDIRHPPYHILYVDVGRLEQVFLNILGNAIKFSPEGGTIDVTLENLSITESIVTDRLVVRDYGIGMSKEFLQHIFEPFRQEHQDNKTKFKGTGLGMSITKQIVTLMGGSIDIESDFGVGTTVTLILSFPIASPDQLAFWQKQKAARKLNSHLKGKRILICEDHLLNTNILTRLLKKEEVLVDTAENGQIGYQKFISSENGFYHAILMDIRMPVMDGLQATTAIRHSLHPQAKIIPIIATTANAFDSDVMESRKVGMTAHISKPIVPETLYSVLSSELRRVEQDNHLLLFGIHKHPMVLVVDDVALNREVMAQALSEQYDVLCAENGIEALELLEKTGGIVAVITDIQMPGMSGLELIHAIRRDERYHSVALIANTQYGDQKQEEDLLLCGADDFVYKPTTPKIVTARLESVLRKYGR